MCPFPATLATTFAKVATGSYFSGMRVVGLKLLKNKLAEYVRMAEAGEHILVTDRDRVVAELRPAEGRGPFVADAMLADAMRRGWLSAPVMVRQDPPPRLPVAPTAQIVAELDADRGER